MQRSSCPVIALAVSATIGVVRSLALSLDLANPARRRQPVHDRHLQIHEHDVEGSVLIRLDAFGAVVGDTDLAAHALEEAHRDFLIDGVVLDQQHVAL